MILSQKASRRIHTVDASLYLKFKNIQIKGIAYLAVYLYQINYKEEQWE